MSFGKPVSLSYQCFSTWASLSVPLPPPETFDKVGNNLDCNSQDVGRRICDLHVKGRGQECRSTSHRAQGSHSAQKHLAPNVSSAEVVQPLARGKVTEVGHREDREDWWWKGYKAR